MPDVNVRNVPAEVLDRLREQAAAEGVSVSEWVRVALADRAALPTTAELVAARGDRSSDGPPREAFDRYYEARLRRRSA